MKIKRLFIAVLASAAIFAGCDKPETVTGEAKVSVNPETLTFTQEASSLTIEITATRDWSVKNSTEWITEITPSEGTASNKPQTVTIKVAANEGKTRNAEIKFRAGVASATLPIVQEGPLGETKPIEEGDGTKDKPYNPSQAHQIAVELGSGNTASTSCYVKGIVHKLASKHTDEQIQQYGNGSFYISDNGESSETDFYCFQVNYLGNTKFTSADQIKVGDEVMVYCTITNYSGTCETTSGGSSYIVELNGEFNDGKADIEKAESKTIAEFIAAADKNTYYKLTGTVSSYKYGSYMTFDLVDDTGKIYIYKIANQTEWKDKISDGGTVTLVGKYDYYEKNKQHEVVAAQILSFEIYEGKDINTEKVADVLAAKDGDNVTLSNVLVVATSKAGYLVYDGTDYVLCFYKASTPETLPVAIGDKVTVKAKKGSFGDPVMAQLIDPETTVISSGAEVNHPEAQDITSTFDSFKSSSVTYVSFTGNLTIDSSKGYYNVAVDGASTNIGCFINPSIDVTSFAGVDGVVYKGYFIYLTGGKYVYIILTSAAMPDGPYLYVNPASANVAADGGEVEITITGNVAWTASSDDDAFVIDNESGENNGTIKVTVSENTEFESRTANITISTEEEAKTKSYTVSIKQAAAKDPNATVIYLTNEEIIAAVQKDAGNSASYGTYEIASAGGNWNGNFAKLSTSTYLQIRNNNASYLTSPTYDKSIDHIVINAVKGGFTGSKENNRTFYAMPVVDPAKLPTGKDANKSNITYTDDTFKGNYGSGSYELLNGSPKSIEIEFPEDVTQFSILVGGGAAYIGSIEVYLNK